jgi:hypothetical protein
LTPLGVFACPPTSEAVLKVVKCVVWAKTALPQGKSELGYAQRAIPLGWKAAPSNILIPPTSCRRLILLS